MGFMDNEYASVAYGVRVGDLHVLISFVWVVGLVMNRYVCVKLIGIQRSSMGEDS